MTLRCANRLFIVALLANMTTLAIAADAPTDAIKKDRQHITGTWRIVALVVDGAKSQDEDARKLTVVNEPDGTWTLRSEGMELSKGSSTIDPANAPKIIDFKVTAGGGSGQQHEGIYELGEKTRKLCFAAEGKARPTEFTSTPGSGNILVTFEREP